MTDTSLIDGEAERSIVRMSERGVFRLDTELGMIWRVGVINRGKLTKLDCPRRAEHARGDGYLRIRVMINGVRVQVSAHRVLYLATHGEIPEGHVIDHKNGRRHDNRASNLEAVTPSENIRRIWRRDKTRSTT